MSKRSTIIGYVTIILLLTAGAAQGLSGSNTVFSDDIVDGQVGYGDIKTGAVGGAKILDGAVATADLASNAVTGPKIAKGGVTGADTHAAGEKSLNFPNIAAGACADLQLVADDYTPSLGQPNPGFDTGMVSADQDDWPSGLAVHTEFFRTLVGPETLEDSVYVVACNVTAGAIDPPSTKFKYVVMAITPPS